MSRSTTRRLVAILLTVAVLCFAFEVAAHWHSSSYEDQQCQLCHFAHSLSVDFSQGTVLPAPAPTHRSARIAWIDPHLELVLHQLSSRAPPAQFFS